MRTSSDIFGDCASVSGKSIGEFLAERIEVIRISVMTQRPDRYDLRLIHRFDHWIDTRKIVFASAVDERPRNTLTRDGDPQLAQQVVIVMGVFVVLCFLDQIPPPGILPMKRRTLKPGQKKGWEDPRSLCHGYRLANGAVGSRMLQNQMGKSMEY